MELISEILEMIADIVLIFYIIWVPIELYQIRTILESNAKRND